MSSIIYIGIKGKVIALDRTTGQQIWEVHLRGSGFVNVLLDQDVVLATAKGEVFCLRAESGEVLWNNYLPGQGTGLISLATSTAHSNFAPFAEKERQEEQDAAVALLAATSTST